ncbi:hypothetical protein KIPB_005167, partial [Kipferlia bialata]
ALTRSARAKVPVKKSGTAEECKMVVLEVLDREYFFSFPSAEDATGWAGVLSETAEAERASRSISVEGGLSCAGGMRLDIGEGQDVRDQADMEEEAEGEGEGEGEREVPDAEECVTVEAQ